MNEIVTGNTFEDGKDYKQWVVGYFVDKSLGLRRDPRVEVRWSVHSAGEARPEWAAGTSATTMTILISGKFANSFREVGEVLMERQGDYILYPPGADHTWRAIEDSVVLTIRWPSEPL